MNTYYVYAYLRKDGTPYYIGKGKGRRAWDKGKNEVGKPTLDRIIIVENNLTNIGALAIERRLIKWYGRKDLGTGILRNQTNGGDGGPGAKKGTFLSTEIREKISKAHLGIKRKPMSEESKKKLSDSLKGKNVGKIRTQEQRQAMSERQKGRKGTTCTQETKQKLREINLGKHKAPFTEEHKQKIANALKGKVRTAEHSSNLSNSLRGRKPTDKERENYLRAMEIGRTKCEHCGKIAILGNYRRWHGVNCKQKPI